MVQELLLQLVLLLAVSKFFEKILGYIDVNPVVAHVVAGLVIGPYVLGLVNPSEQLKAISYLGLILLMFYTGLTTSFRELRKASLWIIVIGLSGFGTTLALCFLALNLMGFSVSKSLLLSMLLSNTATEVVAAVISRTSNDFIKSIVIGASVVDDIVAVIVIGVVTSEYLGVGDHINVFLTLALSIAFMLSIIALSQLFVDKPEMFYQRLASDRVAFASTSILIASTLALVSRYIGLNELVGVYLAGLLVNRGRESHDPMLITNTALAEFVDQLKMFIESLALPLFFTYVGLLALPTGLNPRLYLVLLATALIGKIIGCGVPSYLMTKDKSATLLVGIAMTGRGALETVLLKLLLDLGTINFVEYTTLLFISLTTTILTPLLYGLVVNKLYG